MMPLGNLVSYGSNASSGIYPPEEMVGNSRQIGRLGFALLAPAALFLNQGDRRDGVCVAYHVCYVRNSDLRSRSNSIGRLRSGESLLYSWVDWRSRHS